MKKAQRLIVFFVPPEKIINGGILSIFSIAATSREYRDIHRADVLLCVYPGHETYAKNDLFDNDERVYSFDEVVALGIPEFLQIHVPEGASPGVLEKIKPYADYLASIPDLRVNIMNQNILYMLPPAKVAEWRVFTPQITQTTAHNKYSTQELADAYDIPTHHLSTFVDHRQYVHRSHEEKENVIALSNDKRSQRQAIVEKLQEHLPEYELVTIKDMRYEDYKACMSKAKYTITFGEGFDGYYVEGFFTGGITFAVYNDDFFPSTDFARFDNIYASYDAMLDGIVRDIRRLDTKASYEKVVQQNLELINRLYNFSTYKQNLKNFYLEKFTYRPEAGSTEKLLVAVVQDKEALKDSLDEKEITLRGYRQEAQTLRTALDEQRALIVEQQHLLKERDADILRITNSLSWKLTRPIRGVVRLLKK